MSFSTSVHRAVAVAIVVVLTLTACGDDGDDAAGSTTTSESTTTTAESTTTGQSTSTTAESTSTSQSTTTTAESTTTSESSTADLTIGELGLSLEYPAGWIQDVDYGEWAFFGDDGFFLLTVTTATGGLDAVAANEANHVLAPYGTEPTVTSYSVDGREARLIVPSSDSPAVVERFRQSAIIVPLTEPDSYLTMFSDPNNIERIAMSLRWQT